MFRNFTASLAVLFAVGLPAMAAEKTDAAKIETSLSYQQGKIALLDGAATLDLPATYRFLGPADAQRVLTEVWGNAPVKKILGMIVPSNTPVAADGSWGVVVRYDKNGHVDDSGADSLDAAGLLKEKQQQEPKENEQRKEKGLDTVTLVGWAEAPRYDKAGHKLTWAEEMAFGGSTGTALNYNMRILGREGALVLNSVASMGQIAQIRGVMGDVARFTTFNDGHRYADFNSHLDKVAHYELAALVRGEAPRVGRVGRLWVGLRNMNLYYILAAITIGIVVVVRGRVALAKIRPGQGAS